MADGGWRMADGGWGELNGRDCIRFQVTIETSWLIGSPAFRLPLPLPEALDEISMHQLVHS